MLTLLRAEDFRRTLQRSPVELSGLIQGVVDQVRPFIHARQLHLQLVVAEDLGTFEIDADKISAVLVNLLTNAIKFTPDQGRIELSAELDEGDEARICVADRGVGLEPQALKHLFQPFFTQFDPSRHSSGDFGFNKRGLGLGLSIGKQFVEMHGGADLGRERSQGRHADHGSPASPCTNCPVKKPPYPCALVPGTVPGGIDLGTDRRASPTPSGLGPASRSRPPGPVGSFPKDVRCPQR